MVKLECESSTRFGDKNGKVGSSTDCGGGMRHGDAKGR